MKDRYNNNKNFNNSKNAAAKTKITVVFLLFAIIFSSFPLFASSGTADERNKIAAILSDGFYNPEELDITFTGEEYLTKNTIKSLSADLYADGLYLNAAIPFAYDYAGSGDTGNKNGDTKVTGRSNTGAYLASYFNSLSSETQLLTMKVYTDTGAFSAEAAVLALCDAAVLGASVIVFDVMLSSVDMENKFYLSLLDSINALEEAGITVVCPAGDGFMTGNQSVYSQKGINNPLTVNSDYGILSHPAVYEYIFAAASSESIYYTDYCIRFGDSGYARYTDTNLSSEVLKDKSFTQNFDGQEIKYVVIPGTGKAEDYIGLDLTESFALIERGEISFVEKLNNAADAGAIGAVVYDNIKNNNEKINMAISGAAIPGIFVSAESGEQMKAEKNKTIKIKDGDSEKFDVYNGGIISGFSARSSSLKYIKPDFASVGGKITLTKYDTKMLAEFNSTRYAAVSLAVQALEIKSVFNFDNKDLRLYLKNISSPVKTTSGIEYSPRAQGAGAFDESKTIKPSVVLTSATAGKTDILLGDGLKKSFPITVSLHNISDENVSGKLSLSILGDEYTTYYEINEETGIPVDSRLFGFSMEEEGNNLSYYNKGKYGNNVSALNLLDLSSGYPYFVNGNPKAFDKAHAGVSDITREKINLNRHSNDFVPYTVNLKPYETKNIKMLVTIDDESFSEYSRVFKNGFFVDGYVYFETDSGVCSIPYTGYAGSYSILSVFDSTIFDESSFYRNTYYYSYLYKNGVPELVPLGKNNYNDDENIYKNLISFSPNSDGLSDKLHTALNLMRDIAWLRIEIANEENETIYKTLYDFNIFKNVGTGTTLDTYYVNLWDGAAFDNAGYIYPDGKYSIKLFAEPLEGGAIQTLDLGDVYLDTAAPELTEYKFNANGELELIKLHDDLGIQFAEVILGEKSIKFTLKETLEKSGSVKDFTATLDMLEEINNIDNSSDEPIYIRAVDYANNIKVYRLNR